MHGKLDIAGQFGGNPGRGTLASRISAVALTISSDNGAISLPVRLAVLPEKGAE
jgi:hypothetical protein